MSVLVERSDRNSALNKDLANLAETLNVTDWHETRSSHLPKVKRVSRATRIGLEASPGLSGNQLVLPNLEAS